MEADHTMDGWARLTDVGVLLLDRNRGLGCASPHACRLLGCASHAELQSQWPSLLPRLLFAQVDRLQGDSGSHCLTFDLEMSDRVQPLRAEVCPTEDGYLVLIKDRTHEPMRGPPGALSRVDVLQFLSSTIVDRSGAPLHHLQLTASLLQAAATDGEGARHRVAATLPALRRHAAAGSSQTAGTDPGAARPSRLAANDFAARFGHPPADRRSGALHQA